MAFTIFVLDLLLSLHIFGTYLPVTILVQIRFSSSISKPVELAQMTSSQSFSIAMPFFLAKAAAQLKPLILLVIVKFF